MLTMSLRSVEPGDFRGAGSSDGLDQDGLVAAVREDGIAAPCRLDELTASIFLGKALAEVSARLRATGSPAEAALQKLRATL